MEINRILVVDRNGPLCESMDLILSSYGVDVSTCRTAREAVGMAAADAYLIEADDASKDFIRARSGTGALVLLSGGDVNADVGHRWVDKTGAHGWAQKPFEALGVLRRFRELAKEREST